MLYAVLVKQCFYVVIMYVRHWDKVFLCFMLYDRRHEVLNLSRCTKENFTLTVLHIFLNIQCNCFRHTEILHSFRNCNTQFSTQIKEMVDSMTRSEYNGSVVENRNFLLPKFFRRKTFNLDKRPEIYFYAILLCNVVIGRFLWRRLRLRH